MVRDEGKLEGVDRGIPLCWRDKGGNGVCLVNGSGGRQGNQCERNGERVPFGAYRKTSVLWTSCHKKTRGAEGLARITLEKKEVRTVLVGVHMYMHVWAMSLV